MCFPFISNQNFRKCFKPSCTSRLLIKSAICFCLSHLLNLTEGLNSASTSLNHSDEGWFFRRFNHFPQNSGSSFLLWIFCSINYPYRYPDFLKFSTIRFRRSTTNSLACFQASTICFGPEDGFLAIIDSTNIIIANWVRPVNSYL